MTLLNPESNEGRVVSDYHGFSDVWKVRYCSSLRYGRDQMNNFDLIIAFVIARVSVSGDVLSNFSGGAELLVHSI